MSYIQLAREQRYQIKALLKMGHNQTQIAKAIGVNKSTIGRELRRNRGQRGYRPKQAYEMAVSRRKKKAKTRIPKDTWLLIENRLCQDWSPEQITGWLKRNNEVHISHESIYQYILADKQAGGDLHKHLRCQKKQRKL